MWILFSLSSYTHLLLEYKHWFFNMEGFPSSFLFLPTCFIRHSGFNPLTFCLRIPLGILVLVLRNLIVFICLNSATKLHFHRRWWSHFCLLWTSQVNYLHGIVCTGQRWVISYSSSTWRETLFFMLLCQFLTSTAEKVYGWLPHGIELQVVYLVY